MRAIGRKTQQALNKNGHIRPVRYHPPPISPRLSGNVLSCGRCLRHFRFHNPGNRFTFYCGNCMSQNTKKAEAKPHTGLITKGLITVLTFYLHTKVAVAPPNHLTGAKGGFTFSFHCKVKKQNKPNQARKIPARVYSGSPSGFRGINQNALRGKLLVLLWGRLEITPDTQRFSHMDSFGRNSRRLLFFPAAAAAAAGHAARRHIPRDRQQLTFNANKRLIIFFGKGCFVHAEGRSRLALKGVSQ